MRYHIALLFVLALAAVGIVTSCVSPGAPDAPPYALEYIRYGKDDRTGVCFAFALYTEILTAVPCEKVERFVTVHRKKD